MPTLPPEATDDALEVEAGNLWAWHAWDRLSDERQWQTRGVGVPMGGTLITPFPCRIPWSSVRTWSEYHDYDDERMEFLDRCILAMDATFIAWWNEQQKAKS